MENNSDETKQSALAKKGDRSLDAYEEKYMQGQGAILARTKDRAAMWANALLALPMFLSIPAMLTGTTSGIFSGVLLAVVGFIIWSLFSVLRVTVSEEAVNIQLGMFGPTIPLGAIESATAGPYDWKRFGGWGIRMSQGATLYTMPGDTGQAVTIKWTDPKSGKKKTTMIGSRHASVIHAAIQKGQTLALGEAKAAAALPGDDPNTP